MSWNDRKSVKQTPLPHDNLVALRLTVYMQVKSHEHAIEHFSSNDLKTHKFVYHQIHQHIDHVE